MEEDHIFQPTIGLVEVEVQEEVVQVMAELEEQEPMTGMAQALDHLVMLQAAMEVLAEAEEELEQHQIIFHQVAEEMEATVLCMYMFNKENKNFFIFLPKLSI